MVTKEIEDKCLDLVKRSGIIILSNLNEKGYPSTRALLNMKSNGLKEFWTTTNTSSKKVGQIKNGQKASLYFIDEKNFLGLTLFGTVRILQDENSKKKLWQNGFEMYYPKGVSDPDYSVLYFKTGSAEFYHDLSIVEFEI